MRQSIPPGAHSQLGTLQSSSMENLRQTMFMGGAAVKDRHVVNWAESRKRLLEKEEGRGEPRVALAWPEWLLGAS